MIRLLNGEDGPLIAGISGCSWNALRIRALWKAYGCGYDFLRFYAEESGGSVIGVQDGVSFLWLRDPSDRACLKEAAEFLPFTAETFLSEVPLPVEGYRLETGTAYHCPQYPAQLAEGVSNELQAGFAVLSQVFSDSINGRSYPQWYADLSHRVRHGMSKIYTLDGVCTGVRYCVENGYLGIVQLATLPAFRGQGLARRLLAHIAADNHPRNGILLHSQDTVSNGFYERIGFAAVGAWYSYER